MRLGLTGSSGMLGSAIMSISNLKRIRVEPISRQDITNLNDRDLCSKISNFDVIIHAAANTNVEQCESEVLACYRDNTFLTSKILRASRAVSSKFVFISSTGVYGNKKQTPYTEEDPANPTTHHHKSKYISENKVLRDSSSLVIRTGWLFGGSSMNPKNFVANRLKEAMNSDGIIYSNQTQSGNPCFSLDIASRILELVEDNRSGLFNCVNSGFASRLEYVKAIIKYSGLPVKVLPVEAKEFTRLANVSPNECAICNRSLTMGYSQLPSWKDSLFQYITRELQP